MSSKSLTLYLVLLAFFSTLAISNASHHHNHGFKSKHFTLYQRDIFNNTDFTIVTGVAGSSFSNTTAPFGTITVLKLNLTLTRDPSSKVVGDVEGMTVASSFDGLDGLSIVRFALYLEDGYKGTISVLGVVNTLKPSDLPVSGGTGDFLLVQGYISTTLVFFVGLTLVYTIDFHLFWPPYAPHAIKG